MSKCAGSGNQSTKQSRHLVNGSEVRLRRDVRQMSPQSAMLYSDDDNVDDSTLVNRLQDRV